MAMSRMSPIHAPYEPGLVTAIRNLMTPKRTVSPVKAVVTVETGTFGIATPMAVAPTTRNSNSANSAIRTPAKDPFPPHALADPQNLRPRTFGVHTCCQCRNESMNRRKDPPRRILSAVDSLVMSNEGVVPSATPFVDPGSRRSPGYPQLPGEPSQGDER